MVAKEEKTNIESISLSQSKNDQKILFRLKARINLARKNNFYRNYVQFFFHLRKRSNLCYKKAGEVWDAFHQ